MALLHLVNLAIVAAGPVAAPKAAWMKSAADYSQSANGRAVLVMFDGKVVFERYDGGAADQPQMLASGSKSFTGVMAVAAVQDGIIELDDRVCESLTEWKSDLAKARITYRQLLTLTSGLLPGERGAAIRAPAWKDIIAKPMSGTRGGQFEYGAYHLNAFGAALERKLKDETAEAYLKRRVLDPIGVSVTWQNKCADGHPQLGGGAFVTARDWAAFGEFVRLRGQWKGMQVLDAKLLAECAVGTEHNPAYGLTWWLKKRVTDEQKRAIPLLRAEWGKVANSATLPDDLVAACGAGKQRLYVVRSLKLVVVRQGGLRSEFLDTEFLGRLLRGKAGSR